MKLVYGYLAATSSTQHGGVKVTFPLAFKSTKYQCILGLKTNNSGGAIDFQDTGWTGKTTTTITRYMYYVFFDVNGEAGPNILGKDQYMIPRYSKGLWFDAEAVTGKPEGAKCGYNQDCASNSCI